VTGRGWGGRAWLVLAALVAAAAGCGHAEGQAASPNHAGQSAARPAVYVDSVPARAYRELGLVQAYGTGTKASRGAVLDSLRQQGKSMGCDALAKVNVEVGDMKAHAIGVCVEWEGDPLPLKREP
jgi:hypothetical protein